jgi:uncharacterized protein involved in response to NO
MSPQQLAGRQNQGLFEMQEKSSGGYINAPLFAAPHRSMFLTGGIMLLISFALWAVEIAARAGALEPVAWRMAPGAMHALLVLTGVFPFFMKGFVLTAMPRWQGMNDLGAESWLGAWHLLAAGWVAAVIGLVVPGLLVGGLMVVTAGWVMVLRVLWMVAHQPRADSVHARSVTYAMTAGAVALVAWVLFALTGDGRWVRLAVDLGVWWFLLPVFFTVCHRMVPFFSANVIDNYVMVRPRWSLAVVLGASAAHGLLNMLGEGQLAWVVEVPAAGVALWLSWRWRLLPALKVPLLGMLHVGFAWLGVALVLFALQNMAASAGKFVFGMAPLHALGLGFFGSILFGMVSRVTLGHSGQALQADRYTWGLFIAMQAVVVTRLLADLAPSAWSNGLMLVAVLGWLGVFGAWARRYLPTYWRPRSDGKPG